MDRLLEDLAKARVCNGRGQTRISPAAVLLDERCKLRQQVPGVPDGVERFPERLVDGRINWDADTVALARNVAVAYWVCKGGGSVRTGQSNPTLPSDGVIVIVCQCPGGGAGCRE